MFSRRRELGWSTSVSVLALMTSWGASTCTAHAQDTQQTLETVVVTGTGTNITGVAPVGTESIKIDRDQILATGLTTPTDVANTLPQVQQISSVGRQGGTAAYGYGGFGANSSQGTAIDIRGLGPLATLVLVDGRRVAASGAAQTFTEANLVPVAALQRIEIVADGTSGIYGSDAVAGVVNFLVRKDYEGVELSGRYTTANGYDEYGGSITAGHLWDHLFGSLGAGNVLVTYDYDHRNPMLFSSSRYLKQDMSSLHKTINGTVYSGLNITNPTTSGAGITPTPGIPGYIDYNAGTGAPVVYYAVPNAVNNPLNGTALVPGTWNTVDTSSYNDYLPKQTRHQVAGFFNQDITPWLSFYYEGFYTHRETISRYYQNTNVNANIIFSDLSPYYPTGGIPGVGSGAFNFNYNGNNYMYWGHRPVTLHYNYFKDVGPTVANTPDDTTTTTVGFKLKLPFDWNGDMYFTNGIDHTCGICNFDTNLDVQALQHAVDTGLINPLSNAPLTDAQKKLVYGTNLQYGRNMMDDFRIKFDGPLGTLPGGEVKLAIGAEYVYTTQHVVNGANRSHGPTTTAYPFGPFAPQTSATYNEESDFAQVRAVPSYNVFAIDNASGLTRRVEAGFVELYVPIIGEANALPYVKELSLDSAVRYDHYSDFGGTTNPKFGLTWVVNDALTLRSSTGTSFQAPALTQMNPYVFSFHGVFPFSNNSGSSAIATGCQGIAGYSCALLVVGATPDLKPQKSHNWSVGFDYKPDWLEGFKLSATYFDLRYKDQIGGPNVGLLISSPQTYALYKSYVHPISQPSTCAEGNPSTYDPAVLPYLNAVAIYGATTGQICNIQVVLDGRNTNLSSTQFDGIDLDVNYYFDTESWGSLNLSGSVSATLHDNQQTVVGGSTINLVGTIYNPVRFRGRSAAMWFFGSWNANLFMNYVGSYKDTSTPTGVPNYWVPAWITFDAGVTYSFKDDMWDGFHGLRLSVNAQNILDKDPPIVLTNSTAIDPINANPFGRMISLQLTKDF